MEQALRTSQAAEQAARAEAEAQRQRFHEVLLQLPAYVVVYQGPDHVYQFVNPPYQSMFPHRAFPGRPFSEAMPEANGLGVVALFDRVYRTGEPCYLTRWPRRLAFALALLLLAWLTQPLRGQTVSSSILPSLTDPQITTFNSPHTLYRNPSVAPRHELVVFLPGTFGKTRGVGLFCTTAADLGYHVLNLMYPDSVSATVCRDDADSTAFSSFRRAVIEGGTPAHLTVSRANSIENHLLKLLRYLHATRPTEGWGQFLQVGPGQAATNATTIEWTHLVLAGQSQGGGHATWLAAHHRVARVLLFSSPKDWSRYANRPATWYTPSQTPATYYFAFVHEQDRQGCTYAQQVAILRTLQLGAPYRVDGATPPFGHARAFITNYPGTPITSQLAHATEVTDARTPKNAKGLPLFQPVWEYMLTAQ